MSNNNNNIENYRIISSVSSENRTTTSTRFNQTHQLIKEIHSLNSHRKHSRNYSSTLTEFYKPLTSFDNFHHQTLRDSIHNNKKYSNFFLSSYSTINSLKKKAPCSLKHTKTLSTSQKQFNSQTHFYSEKLPSSKSKVKINSYHNKSRNYLKTTSDTLHRIQTLTNGVRAESISDFMYKTQTITKQNYLKNLNLLNYDKHTNKVQNDIDLVNLNLNNYYKSENLVNVFSQTYKNYNRYLERVLSENVLTNLKLKGKKLQIVNDIHVLKNKLKKYQGILEDNIKNKYFLMCVKNNSTHHEKFSPHDKEEYMKDQYCLLKLTSIHKYLTYKCKKQKKNSINSRNLLENALTLGLNDVFTNKSKPYIIFSSVDDFETHLDNISYTIAKLLMKFNNNQIEISSLKKEMSNLEKARNSNLYFTSEIKEAEQKLLLLKKKYKDNNEYYKNISGNSLHLNKVKMKIIKTYKIINNVFNFKSQRKITYNISTIDYLEDIEKGINELLALKEMYKQYKPSQFNAIQNEIDQTNKLKLMKTMRDQRKQQYIDKIQRVINKSNHIVKYKPNKRSLQYSNLNKLLSPRGLRLQTENDNIMMLEEEMHYYFNSE